LFSGVCGGLDGVVVFEIGIGVCDFYLCWFFVWCCVVDWWWI